jgi:hypothetical protein
LLIATKHGHMLNVKHLMAKRRFIMQLLTSLIVISLLLVSTLTYAYENTHDVRAYTKSDGTYVEEHLSGNPYSGVHCHHNVCE